MSEFEWRRRLRDLRVDSDPPAHVWAGIASRIGANAADQPTAPVPERGRLRYTRWPVLAAAAMVIVALAVALVATSPRPESPGMARQAPVEVHPDRNTVPAADAALMADLARNPVLAATDAELRELQEQLQLALAQQPESSRLRRMLMRTQDERRRLLQYQSQLG